MHDIVRLMDLCAEKGASDLHLSVGRPPVLRIGGRLRNVGETALVPGDVQQMAEAIMPIRLKEEFETRGTVDFAYAHADKARFRVSVLHQKTHIGVVMRLIPTKLRSFAEIGLPEGLKELLVKPRGLILVTGPTGSGKTTTLATMIDFINQNHDKHIVTIEDPIEYYHRHGQSIVTQRDPKFIEIVLGLREKIDHLESSQRAGD